MNLGQNLILLVLSAAVFSGCASSGSHFYDSALNDRNRAPASIALPKSIGGETDTIDSVHNQAQADFLYLQSEMASQLGNSTETVRLLKNAMIFDAQSAELKQRLAIEYYKVGKIEESLNWAEKAYETSPDKREIALLYAGLHTTNKNYDTAEQVYKKLTEKDPKDYEARLYLGAVYSELKQYAKAVQVFKSLSREKANTSAYLAHYYLARLYAEQKLVNSAVLIKEELQNSIKKKPDFIDAIMMLGQYIQKSSGLKAVVSFYEKLQKQNPQVKIAEILAQHYISQSQYDKAYEQLAIIDENTEDAVQVKLKMALILIERKIYDKAVEKLQEILVLAPDSDKVRFYLSAVYEEQKQYDLAVDNYLQIPQESSFYEEARVHAAYVKKNMGQINVAIGYLTEVVTKKAEGVQTYLFLSQLHEEKEDMPSSLKVLKKATEKFPDNSQLHYYLGVLQDKMNLKSEMLVSMEKVVDLEPDHSQALNYLAYTWAEEGVNLEKAESYARLASNKEKNDPYILDTLGWVYFKKGDYKKAVEVLEKAFRLQPEAGIIAEHLGDVYLKLNKIDKARAHFLRAVALEGDDKRKKEINQKISLIEVQIKSSRQPSSVAVDTETDKSP